MGPVLIITAFALAASWLEPFVTVRTTTVQVDAVSGEIRKLNLWLGGHRSTSAQYDALARRLKALNIPWQPDWRTINQNGYDLFGSATSRGCSTAPPVYQLHPVLEQFATGASVE